MITDEQLKIACDTYNKLSGINAAEPSYIRKALEAYEASKWVIDGRLPPKAGERDDGNWYSHYVYDPDNDAVIYYDSESDEYHKPNGSGARDPSRYYLLPEFKV